jgi:hypothetical protein
MTTQISWVPVAACTLPTTEQPLRVAEFDDLFAGHLTGVQQHDAAHARLRLTGGAGLEARVQQLADRESGCCSFFTFTVTAVEGDTGPSAPRDGATDEVGVLLDIAVAENSVEVLAALLVRAQTTCEAVTGT